MWRMRPRKRVSTPSGGWSAFSRSKATWSTAAKSSTRQTIDDAIARFDQLSRPAPRLENTASRANARYLACVNAHDLDAVASILADDFCSDDRRRVTGAGTRRGRDAELENMRVVADLGANITVEVIATRGDRLVLTRAHFSFDQQQQQGFVAEVLSLVETDLDGRIAATILLDLEDFDAAIAELDARYIAGEAAAHSHTWSVIARMNAAFNRRELPPTTPDWVNIDHRRGTSIAPGEMPALLSAAWNVTSDLSNFIEAVHRLDNLGAVITHVANETSQEGFHAEWRVISLLALDGDLVNRCEVFDDADLDTAIARFDQLTRPVPRLENAASRVAEHLLAHFAAGDWDAVADTLAADYSIDDRRRVVNAGIRQGRDAAIEELTAAADVGFTNVTSAVRATRGGRLVLMRVGFSSRDQGPEAFQIDALHIAEIDADERIVAVVSFDPDDFDAAIAELDARYLAGEAAAHAQTWSLVTSCCIAFNRRETPASTPDWVNADYRRTTAFAAGDAVAYVSTVWDLAPDVNFRIEAVHRLSNQGAVVAFAAYGTTQDGFEAEWRAATILIFQGDLINRCEVFDEADLGTALARFEELHPQTRRLENAASQVAERFRAHSAADDWDAVAEILADDFSSDDRRRVVGAGVRHGPHAEILNMQAIVGLGITIETTTVMATRGERLVLVRTRFALRDPATDAFVAEVLGIAEIDTDNRIAAHVVFDLDDFDAAIAELDARYAAGEAAAHSETWLVIAEVYAALNRGEMPATAPDLVDIDHRSLAAIGSGDLKAYLQAALEDAPRSGIYIETVHRLTDLGAVTTHVVKATSREGFDAEWRITSFFIVGGDLVNRYEIFDEADLDTALARFDQLSRPAPQLENAATKVYERLNLYFAERDWAAMTEILAGDVSSDDRRRVVNAGLRTGRDAVIAEISGFAEIGVTDVASDIIAVRGRHLALSRIRSFARNQPVDAFQAEAIHVIEIDADERIAAIVVFDVEDIEAAFQELDARYLAGDAATHSRTWSLVAAAYACYNRRELPATTPDWVNVDRRRMTMYAPGDVFKYVRGGWNYISDISFRIEAVHQLSNLGAVVTQTGRGTSQEGFDAEWREIHLMTVEGDLFNRSEMFDEADLDAAIARFEELHPQTRRLENAASQVAERFMVPFTEGDWDAVAEMLADNFSSDDRRRVVGAGVRLGRDAQIADVRAIADLWIMRPTVMATRGDRLVLMRVHFSARDQGPAAFLTEALSIVEINADERIVATVAFGIDDIDAAIAELDARYIAGEAANHSRTWSVIAGGHAALNRHELPPTTPDCVSIDHRRGTAFAPGELIAYFRAGWDLKQDIRTYVEVVHRLSDLGAVCTHAAHGISHEGFDAEWRGVDLLTVEGDMVNRCEVFEEADLDAAIARFEQLNRPEPRLENAASRVYERYRRYFAGRDWAAITAILADDLSTDDRRRTVGAGVRLGRDAEIEDMQAIADIGVDMTADVIATRGERLALTRTRFSRLDQQPQAFLVEVFGIVEIEADERIVARIGFDIDDIGAAFEELDARYLAGEAAAHAHTWSIIARAYAAFNRHELPATTPDWVNIDHRRGIAFAPGDASAYLRAWVDSRGSVYVETVHRLSNLGAVFTWAGAWDLATGLRSRVAGDQRSDSRRRSDQPRRDIRRGRPRRRARAIR